MRAISEMSPLRFALLVLAIFAVATAWAWSWGQPRSPHGDLIEQTDREPVQVSIQPRCCP